MLTGVWHNAAPSLGMDVNGDGAVSSADATVLGDYLVSLGEGPLSPSGPPAAAPGSQTWLDTNDDNNLTIADLTALVNAITASDEPAPNVMRYRLDTTNTAGTSISSVQLGDTFLLKVYVQDIRTGTEGIASVGLDVNYSRKIVSYVNGSLIFDDNNAATPLGSYNDFQTIGSTGNGVLNDVGAVHKNLANAGTPPGTVELLAFQAQFRVGGVADAFTINEDAGTVNFNVLANDTTGGVATFQAKGPENPLIRPVTFDTIAEVQDTQTVFGSKSITYSTSAYTITAINGTTGNVATSKGVASIAAGGQSVNYRPNDNASGTDTFTYTITAGARTDVVTVTVTINAVNDPPVAVLDTKSTNKNTDLPFTISGDLVSNDSPGPLEGSPAVPAQSVIFVSIDSASAQGGTVTGSGDSYIYHPPTGFTGVDTVKYRIRDNVSATQVEGTLQINVTSQNTAPTAGNDNRTATEDDVNLAYAIQGAGGLTANDSANDAGQTLTFSLLGTPNAQGEYATAHGKVKLDGAGNVLYTPTGNYNGSDSFTYRVTDNGTSNGQPDPKFANATVFINVAAVNDPPVVVNKAATVAEDPTTPLSIAHATLLSGQLPAPAAATDEASQTLSIPSFSPKSSVQGGVVTWTAGTITYQPAANYFGPDSFTIDIADNGSPPAINTITVNVTVTPVNDRPTAGPDSPGFLVYENAVQGPTFVQFHSNLLLANDTAGAFETNNTLSIKSVATKSLMGGVVTYSSTTKLIKYTRPAGYSGPDSFTYVVVEKFPGSTSTTALTATGTVNLNVIEFNDAPTAVADSFTIPEGSPAQTYTAAQLLGNDVKGPASEAAQTLTITGVTNLTPEGGSLQLVGQNVVYTPATEFFGAFKFTYTIADNGTTGGVADPKPAPAPATVTVNVTPVNDPVDAVNDSYLINEGRNFTVTAAALMANDSKGPANESGQTLAFKLLGTSTPAGGTISYSSTTKSLTYKPALGFIGLFKFTYSITDNGSPASTDTAEVTLNVANFNDPPVAGADAKTAVEDTDLVFSAADLLANDTTGPANESAQHLTVTAVSGPTAKGGFVTLSGGNITYTPPDDFFTTGTGTSAVTDSFTYTVTDDGFTDVNPDPRSAQGTVKITVTPVNDAPQPGDDSVLAVMNVPRAIVVRANDSKGAANESTQTLTIVGVSGPGALGGVMQILNGELFYTPATGATGTETFTYTVQDNGVTGTTADPKQATATVTVDLRPYAPHTYSGRVYTDVDGDGVLDANERGLAGVPITLTGTDDLGQLVSLNQVTKADGSYLFADLRPGNYKVTETAQPKFTGDGKETVTASRTLPSGSITKPTTGDYFTVKGVAQKTAPLNITGNFGEKPITTTLVASAKQPQLAYLSSTGQKTTPPARDGVVMAVDPLGAQYWQSFQDGWAGVKSASLTLSSTLTATLTVVRENDETEIYELTTANNQFEILNAAATSNYIVRIKGSLDAIDAFFGG